MYSNIKNGLVMIDLDGTLIPDSELRNQRVIQATLNNYLIKSGLPEIKIDWHQCCGHSEDNILRILIADGNKELTEIVTPEDFRKSCMNGFKLNEPDYTARKGIIETVLALQEFDIGSAIVSNSEGARVHLGLKEAFKIANLGVSVEEAFPLVITKDDFAPNQLSAKPSPDPYWHAYSLIGAKSVERSKILILEDSPPGTKSAFHFTRNEDQVIQFTDVGAPPDEGAGHHVTSMKQCTDAICARFGIKIENFERAKQEIYNPRNILKLVK